MTTLHTPPEHARRQTPPAFPGNTDGSPRGLTSEEARRRLEQVGPNELAEQRENPLLKFLGYFWGPIPWMIEIAAALSLVVRHWVDLVIILVMLAFNAVVGFWQEFQASNALAALKKSLALTARVLRDGQWQQLAARELVPGDAIRVRPGDIIPADIKLVDGEYLSVDQSALTGESLPVDKQTGDVAYSGSVAKQGEMVALVTATGGNTKFAKTAKLVEKAGAVSHFQKAVLAIGDYLIYVSLGLAAVLVLTQLLRGDSFLSVFQFVLILVVAAIPVAMPAVLSVTMALGAVALSRMKAIVTRLQSIEEIAGIDVLCSDKTGTLTANKLSLGEPVVLEAEDEQDLLRAAALASKTENRDAIDDAIIGGLTDRQVLHDYEQLRFTPFDAKRKRTDATIRAADGRTFAVAKGAPQVILDLCNATGDARREAEARVDEFATRGFRTLGVARRQDGAAWHLLGILPLYDPPREDSADVIRDAGEHGIAVKMVTGDNLAIARETSRQLGLKPNVLRADEIFGEHDERQASPRLDERVEQADGFAQVYPEHKYEIVRALQRRGHLVGMTGDGVNDAPALKQADVGIAVAGATNAAQAAASLVLTAPGLNVIIKAIEEARRIFERMTSYATYRITETIRIMFFVVLAMITFNLYPITTVMIILLALLNDLPILTIAYDNTRLDPRPVRWSMRRVLTVSTILGLVGVVQSFALLLIGKLWFALDAAQLQSFIYLKLAVAGHLTLFVVRTERPFWTRPYPARLLLSAVLGTQIIAALIVGFGFLVAAIPWSYIGFVWLYCLAWFLINDWVKLQVFRHLDLGGTRHRTFLQRLQTTLHPHRATEHASN
ncbi:MAG: plasma-membrane proton-efflux P-type ATPase [Phycisphaerae bacterium]|jgi:H+-transporting ATPase